MTAVRTPPAAAPQANAPPMLCVLGSPCLVRPTHRQNDWSYAKLPAMLTLLAAAGGAPVRRDWLAALLWPEHDAASLRRALYDLRRQLRGGRDQPALVESSRESLWLGQSLATDLTALQSAWQDSQRGALDPQRSAQALALWRGELADGLTVPGADDFELWLLQERARWQQRALELAVALAEHHLHAGQVGQALEVARLAVERVPDAESARAIVWRCLVATGARLQAAEDCRRWRDVLASQGLAFSAALRGVAADLGLLSAPPAAPPTADDDALAEALGQALRQGQCAVPVEALLRQVQARLQPLRAGAASARQLLLLRRALMLRLMHSPWHDEMGRLAAVAETLLCAPLAADERLELVQPLATWHGWMGRGVRGEVLLRSLGDAAVAGSSTPAARVRWEMTLALCHSCSTGDPERSIRAARRGLKIARDGAVPGCRNAFLMLVANAALNRGQPGDVQIAERALAAAGRAEPLQRFDLVNHHALSAHWQLIHGSLARALAEAEQGERMAYAVPFPLQGLACSLQALSAHLLLGDMRSLDQALDDALALARRIGAQGYLMNALFLGAVLAARGGDRPLAALRRDEAQAIARACGAQRIRKIPPVLLHEALSTT